MKRRLFLKTAALFVPLAPSIVRAQGLTLPGPGLPVASGGGGGTTLNPAFKDTAITLTNGNLTATATASGFLIVGSTVAKSSGKFYYEVTTVAGAANRVIGIANSSQSLGNFVGSSVNSAGWNLSSGDGRVFVGGANPITIQSSTVGDTVSVAVDLTAQLIWFRDGAGNWNNSGTANPATGTEGISISVLNAGSYFPAFSTFTAGDSYTANFGATAFAQTPPSGFGNWQ